MALKSWSSITDSLSDLIDYVRAETNEAYKYCSAAYPYYAAALQKAEEYWSQTQSETGSTASAPSAVSTVKQEVEYARTIWRSMGCSKPSTSGGTTKQPEPADAPAPGPLPSSGGIPWWLIAGGVGLVAYLLLKKKPGQQSVASKAVARIRRKRS